MSTPQASAFASSLHPIHFKLGEVDINLDSPDSAVAKALLSNQPFPAKEVSIGQVAVRVSGSQDVKLDGGKGTVRFSGSANAYSGVGVYQSGDNLVKALQAADLADSIVAGLRVPSDANSNLIALQWGYDAAGAVNGKFALGAGAAANFGIDANAQGLFAVIRQLPKDTGAYTAVEQTINSWKLPRQVHSLNDLEPGTWLVAETNAAIALSLGIQYGYNLSWVREDVALGGLSGDIGLKVKLGVMATLGFDASGRYALVLSREVAQQNVIRFRVYKLNRKGWSFAFNASANAQFKPGSLAPENLSDFIKGVFNIQGLQVIKDFERWTDPDSTITELLGADLVDYAKKFLQEITGIDPETAFNEARDRFQSLIKKWHVLPHEVSSTLYFVLRDQGGELETLRRFLRTIENNATPEAIAKEIGNELKKSDFFTTVVGKWLSAAAAHGIVTLLNSTHELKTVHDLAGKTLAILDGSTVENTLKKTQQWIEDKLGLDKIIKVADQTDFAKIDAWLKTRLSSFLGKEPSLGLIFQEFEKIKAAINAIKDKSNDFYAQGIEALKRKYTAEFIATYQKTTTKTALLDVEFDFGADANDPIMSGYLQDALNGNLNEFIIQQMPGVHLNQATLTHEIKRHTHIEVNLPYHRAEMDHINDSLAQASAVDTADGRLLLYDLDARDIVSRRNRRDSQLAVAFHFSQNTQIRQFSEATYSYNYSLHLVQRNMKQQFLRYQFKNLVTPYFRSEFEAPGKQPFDTYVSDLDRAADPQHPGTDNLGNSLLSLEVSLPSSVLGAWKNAPLNGNDPAYMRLSLHLQAKLREIVPFCYFQDASKYRDLNSAIPLLVYSSMQLANHVALDNGQPKFDSLKDIYWDWVDDSRDGLRSAVITYYGTAMNLKTKLAGIREILAANPELSGLAGFYEDSEISKMLKLVIEDNSAKTLLSNLLYVEAEVIYGARDAGVEFAKFFGEPKPDRALKLLMEFGSGLTETFNSKITSIYKGDAVRALGTMIFIEAARALHPDLGTTEPTAMLDLIILNQQAQFVPEQFLQNRWPPPNDVFLAQRLISLGASDS